jgi:hypothetical protein
MATGIVPIGDAAARTGVTGDPAGLNGTLPLNHFVIACGRMRPIAGDSHAAAQGDGGGGRNTR